MQENRKQGPEALVPVNIRQDIPAPSLSIPSTAHAPGAVVGSQVLGKSLVLIGTFTGDLSFL